MWLDTVHNVWGMLRCMIIVFIFISCAFSVPFLSFILHIYSMPCTGCMYTDPENVLHFILCTSSPFPHCVFEKISQSVSIFTAQRRHITVIPKPKKGASKIKGNQHSVSSQTKHWLKIKAKVVNCKISNPATHHWNRHLVVFLTWQDDGRWLHNVSCCSNLREWAHPAL